VIAGAPPVEPPLALLAEVTHRCPLRCPYCSNPIELDHAGAELDTGTWRRVLCEAAALGVLQVHFSGGEPLARRDLTDLIRHAAGLGLYANLITSGIGLDAARLAALVDAGLEHVQLSLQDVDMAAGDRVAGLAGAQRQKHGAARLVRDAGLPLTVNAVMHRQNLDRLGDIVELALGFGADRLEIAHVQYYGWALKNLAALLPSRAQLDRATALIEAARARLKGVLAIDYVVPDYHAARPKACMGGWGRRFLNVTPAGKVLPCHAAETLPGMRFPNVAEADLAWIWGHSQAFERFRGTAWMKEPCRSCARREIDWGGCRCQAFALAGDAAAADPVCELSPDHALLAPLIASAPDPAPDFVYRQFAPAHRLSRSQAGP
jgi:PqqA peptide cyclase